MTEADDPEDTDDGMLDPEACRAAREEDARREARRDPPEDEDEDDGPCCNFFDCPCGGSGSIR